MCELCEITSSKRIYVADYQTDGIPFYRGKEIIEKQRGNLAVSTKIFISEDKFNEIKAKFGAPEPGDVLLSSVGTLGVPYVVKNNDRFYFKDGNLTWFRKFNDLDSHYLYYWLLSPKGKAELKKCTIGASQPAFTIVLLKDMKIELPPILTQRKIVKILSAYDDLIENNLRRIQILEEMARLIYQEWFVNFRFPGHEKAKFVDSELGKIPEGWKVERLDRYVDFERGVEPGSNNYEKYINKENVPFLRVGDLGNRNIEIFVNQSLTKNKIIREDDIAVSMDGTPGIVKMGVFGCYSTGIRKLVIKHNVMKKTFLYFLMISEHIQNIIKAHSKGTTILHASEAIKHMNFILPANDIMRIFDDMVSPMIKEILSFNKKNKILGQTRDLLLPKLISGELDVENLDIVIRET